MQTHDPKTLPSTPEGLYACMCDVSFGFKRSESRKGIQKASL